jgi:hypothetical protein
VLDVVVAATPARPVSQIDLFMTRCLRVTGDGRQRELGGKGMFLVCKHF